jgi:GT2 family glycosyltransferase
MKSSNKKPVAAVVVTYNRCELLLNNIGCLLRQTFGKYLDIIIIDNASTDGTAEALKEYADNGSIIYINTGANLGGAGGFHFGMKYAAENGYKYVWVMDDDCFPQPDALEELCRFGKKLKGRFGFLSSKVVWKDGSICKMNVQKETKWKRLKDFDKPARVQYASFVSLFMRTDIIKRLGLPYKEFFIWSDDWEYTRRISRRTKCYYVPSSVVHHFSKANVGADIVSADAGALGRFEYLYRNDVVLYRQDGFDGFMYLMIRDAAHIMRILLKSGNKKEKIALILRSTLKGIKFKPAISYIERQE